MSKTPFIVRKENDLEYSQCCLNQFTLSAIKTEVKRATEVKRGRQVLRQERMAEGAEKPITIKIEDDDDVKNIFITAAQKGREVMVVVTEQAEDDDLEIEGFRSVETVMEST
jgi:uncharacterized glyoxalase superfamily protein PhnB